MRFRCQICQEEASASQATMCTHGGDRPLAACPRCVKKSESAKRSLQQIDPKWRLLDIMGAAFEDIEIGNDDEATYAFLRKALPNFPKIAEAWRTGGLSSAIEVRAKLHKEYREKREALKKKVLGSIGISFPGRKDYKESKQQLFECDKAEIKEKLINKQETNPMKRAAKKRRQQKVQGRAKLREKNLERKRNNKGPQEISLGRSLSGDEAADAIYSAAYGFLTGDEKD